jgi:hypothetical protein
MSEAAALGHFDSCEGRSHRREAQFRTTVSPMPQRVALAEVVWLRIIRLKASMLSTAERCLTRPLGCYRKTSIEPHAPRRFCASSQNQSRWSTLLASCKS